MTRSKYSRFLQKLLNQPFFTAKDAEGEGIPSYALSYFCKRGIIERLSRGLYKSVQYEAEVEVQWEGLALTAKTIPKGVVCLISALSIYELTDQIMREYWIAIPHQSKSPKRPHLRAVRMHNMTLGKVRIKLGKYNINIFDRERTIVDAFRLLSHEIAIKALKAYVFSWAGDYKPDLRKLQKYASLLKVDLHPYILALTT